MKLRLRPLMLAALFWLLPTLANASVSLPEAAPRSPYSVAVQPADEASPGAGIDESRKEKSHQSGWSAALNTLDRLSEPTGLIGLASDGFIQFAVAFAFLLIHLRRQLREAPRWVGWTLLGIVIFGGALRAWLSQENIMEAWAYARVSPLAQRIFNGPILQVASDEFSFRVYLTDLIFKSNFVVASLTPLALFAHARYILKDFRAAVAAAALVALLPIHLRFSRSDVYFIQSVATSSLTFVVLYTALFDPSRLWRRFCFLLLPFLCVATYFLRPENIVFVGLDLGAIYICVRVGVPRIRAIVATATVIGTAVFAFVANLLTRYRGNLERGLDFETLRHAVSIFFDTHLNTAINPWITPPGFTLLAIAGVFFLWRRGERLRAMFLVAWYAFFFLVHSYVLPSEPAMQARYHINLISPMVLMAAAAAPDVLKFPRWAVVSILLYTLSWPMLHRSFIQETRFNEMREYTFITSLREAIPPGCTVLEYRARAAANDPSTIFSSRLERVARMIRNGEPTDRWRLVSLTGEASATIAAAGDAPAIDGRTAVDQIFDAPPACTMFYEGLLCHSHPEEGRQLAEACDRVHRELALEPVATMTFPSRAYDPVNSGPLVLQADGGTSTLDNLPAGRPVTLTLFKASKRSRGESSPQ